MDVSKLTANQRLAAIAAAVVTITGLISIATAWGPLMIVAVLAGLAALVTVFGPQIMPDTRMPGSTGSLLLVFGGAALVIWLVVAFAWIGWIAENFANLDTLQFLLGLIAAAVLTWTGWRELQSEGGKLRLGRSSGEPAPAAASASTAPPPAPTATAPDQPAPSADDENRPAY